MEDSNNSASFIRKASSTRQLPKFDAMTGKLGHLGGQIGEWASSRDWQHYGQWMTTAPGEFGQRVLVMNPMHIVHLSSNTKSRLVKIVEFCRGFTEKWFSHLLLLLVLVLYAILGAWIFLMIEGGYEKSLKAPIVDIRDKLKTEVWRLTTIEKVSRKTLYDHIDMRIKEMESQLYTNYQHGSTGDSFKTSWTFWSAVVYCFTVFTTIGYGHIAPITKVGRIVTIFYACIGIPLLLMVLADLGKLFTRCIKYVFKIFKKVFYAKRLKKMRQAGRRATLAQQSLAQTLKSHGLKFISEVKDRKNRGDKKTAGTEGETDGFESVPLDDPLSDKQGSRRPSHQRDETSSNYHASFQEIPAVTINSPATPYVYSTSATGPGGEPLVILSPRITPVPPNFTGTTSVGQPSLEDGGVAASPSELDDEFNLPVSLALFILFLYMFIGAGIFTYTDNWSYVDAIYFVFISITTVGFGDLTPESEWSMICLSVYLLFGLALTSMCINVIQEQLAVAFEEAKFRLGTRMGIDVTSLDVLDADDDNPSQGGGSLGGRRGSKTKKGTLEENNNKNKSQSLKSENKSGSTFEIKQDSIGKSLKDRREQKRSVSPHSQDKTSSHQEIPTISRLSHYHPSPLLKDPLQSGSTPNIRGSSPQPAPRGNPSTFAPLAPTRRSREGRSPRRNVNFDGK